MLSLLSLLPTIILIDELMADSCTSLTDISRIQSEDENLLSWQFGINYYEGESTMTFGDPEVSYTKFIALHPTGVADNGGITSITYDVSGYDTFTGVAGLGSTYCAPDYGVGSERDGVKFRFYLDDSTSAVLETAQLELITDSEEINIDVSEASTLKIEVDALGHSNCDHAVIAIPELCEEEGLPDTISASGYTVRDAGSISCGETKEGTRSTGDDMPVYSYTAVSDRTQVFLEGCNSVHDIWLYLFDDNGQIYNADDQRNHGDQSGCGNWYAGDITVTTSANAPNAVSVSAGSTYYFGIGSWASRTGDYSVYLDCEPEVCGDASGETSLLGIETGAGNSANGGTTSDVYIRFYNNADGWTNEWFLLDNANCDDFPEAGNSWSSFPDATSIIEDVMGNDVDKVALHIEGCDYLFIKTIVVNGITINVNTGSNYWDYGVVCGQDMVYYVDGTKLKSSLEPNWVGSTALVSDPNQVTTSNASPPIYYIELSLNTVMVIGGLIAIILLCNIILVGKSFIKKRNNPYQVVKRIDTEYETDENV